MILDLVSFSIGYTLFMWFLEGRTGVVALVVHEGQFLAALLCRKKNSWIAVVLDLRMVWLRSWMLIQHVLMDASERVLLMAADRDYVRLSLVLVFFAIVLWLRFSR